MFKKQLLTFLIIAAAIVSDVSAQDVELTESHPETYVVQDGDTLWDISAVFLKSPWLWPEIWHANPQIENPHLIYPGDTINLVYLDGQPRVTVNRKSNHPTVKMSPKTRIISHENAVETIPLSDIEPFLKKLRILSKADIDLAAYVVASEEDRNISAPGNLIYARHLKNAKQGDRFSVVRPTLVYRSVPKDFPWKEAERQVKSSRWEKTSEYTTKAYLERFWQNHLASFYWDNVDVLGYEVAETGIAEVTRVGDDEITTLTLVDSTTEVKKGDLVLPIDEFNFDPYFMPKGGTTNSENIRVVALNNALFGSGKRQVIAISGGVNQEISVGDVFSIYRPEQVIRDEVMHPAGDLKTLFKPSKAKVTLPSEYVGHIMVFKSFENVSYAIITEGNRNVKLFDYVQLP